MSEISYIIDLNADAVFNLLKSNVKKERFLKKSDPASKAGIYGEIHEKHFKLYFLVLITDPRLKTTVLSGKGYILEGRIIPDGNKTILQAKTRMAYPTLFGLITCLVIFIVVGFTIPSLRIFLLLGPTILGSYLWAQRNAYQLQKGYSIKFLEELFSKNILTSKFSTNLPNKRT